MIRAFIRHSPDVSYLVNDPAREIDGLREGSPGWWLRGEGDTRDWRDVQRVFSSTDRSHVVGYDMVVAAPRPISVLLALDTAHGPDIVRAHRVSVAASMGYLEERGLVVRDRRDGELRDQSARWTRLVSFTHGVNRHGEPHLHDHVLVGARPHGARTVLDSRSLFAHLPVADALYRSSLRHEIGARTDWVAWRSFKGVEHVGGLDEGYRSLWGGHHDGRGEKLSWERRDALRAWRQDLDRFEAERTVAVPQRSREHLDEHSFASAFEGRHVIARRHVVAAWANAAVFGQAPRDIATSIDHLYPEVADARGVRERVMSVDRARMTAVVRERGPRNLEVSALAEWRHRSLDRSRSERSR